MRSFRRAAALMAALLLLGWPRVLASAQTGSISVRMTWQGEAVPGGSITLYRITEPGSGLLAQEFAGCGIDFEGPHSPADAEFLAEYAEEKCIQGQTEALGPGGAACFAPLETGLYLLVQQEAGSGFLPTKPFLVHVPQQVGGELFYHVDASPKCAPEPDSPGQPPGIPQTGQLLWPVPVMTVLGLLLLAAGWGLLKKGGRCSHDP